MKRITAAITAAAAVAVIGGTAVFAAGPGYGASGYGSAGNSVAGGNSAALAGQSARVCGYCEQYGEHYTDSDGDGICDYYQAMTEGDTFNGSAGGHRGRRTGGHHQEECIWR